MIADADLTDEDDGAGRINVGEEGYMPVESVRGLRDGFVVMGGRVGK